MDSARKLNDLFDQTEELLAKLADQRGPEIQELREKLHRSMGQTRVALKSPPARRTREGSRCRGFLQRLRAELSLDRAGNGGPGRLEHWHSRNPRDQALAPSATALRLLARRLSPA